MAKTHEIYKCNLCGNLMEVLHDGAGEFVCCGKPMTRLAENTVDASKEKHIPVVEKTADGILVKVGSVPHPMEEKHFIEMIEVISETRVWRCHLKPGEKPEAAFCGKGGKLIVREYCNLHGLWKTEI